MQPGRTRTRPSTRSGAVLRRSRTRRQTGIKQGASTLPPETRGARACAPSTPTTFPRTRTFLKARSRATARRAEELFKDLVYSIFRVGWHVACRRAAVLLPGSALHPLVEGQGLGYRYDIDSTIRVTTIRIQSITVARVCFVCVARWLPARRISSLEAALSLRHTLCCSP